MAPCFISAFLLVYCSCCLSSSGSTCSCCFGSSGITFLLLHFFAFIARLRISCLHQFLPTQSFPLFTLFTFKDLYLKVKLQRLSRDCRLKWEPWYDGSDVDANRFHAYHVHVNGVWTHNQLKNVRITERIGTWRLEGAWRKHADLKEHLENMQTREST